jgi:hypothetical protein
MTRTMHVCRRVFRIYLAANPGLEMAAERAQLEAVVTGPLRFAENRSIWRRGNYEDVT